MKNLTNKQRAWVLAQANKGQNVFEATSMLAYKKHCAHTNTEDDSAQLKCWAFKYCGNKPFATLTDSQKAKVMARLNVEVAQWKS